MANRKDYSLDVAPKRATVVQLPVKHNWIVKFGDSQCDFSRWREHATSGKFADRDDLVLKMCTAVDRMARYSALSSMAGMCWGALRIWFSYLDSRLDTGIKPISTLSDVNREVMDNYASWLLHESRANTKSGRYSYSTARSHYTRIKSVWLECIASGQLDQDCFPDNPFPNSARSKIPHQPYTKNEMQRLLGALGSDLRKIRSSSFEGTQRDRLMVYLLLVAARTGRNPTPLFEMNRDELQPHPVKPETHALLTTYKRRGNNITVQSLKISPREIEDVATVGTDVATLIDEVRTLTEPLANSAHPNIRDYLWLFKSEQVGPSRNITRISANNYHEAIKRFGARHNLKSDNTDPKTGEQMPFQLTFMRLRKTFASRMWELTDGDLVRTALALGNRPKVTDTHYLAVTPEMERNHRFVGKCLEADVRGQSDDPKIIDSLAIEMKITTDEVKKILHGKNNTGVGRCTSPLFGKYAPKNGTRACTAFLHCFRCPNQVILESDLYRIFSFYWLLIKERNIQKRNQWRKIYWWVIREIDQIISPKFDPKIVADARERARINPHVMWRDRAMLASSAINVAEA
ncbi:integrase [Burkholderia cenocepacia]|uniref:integrase n=1 Tax=Burkholderia cenocepacia TaxID=95486 RepID=UPI000F56C986|nr:integrase [Burkholderia cenocepacia]RQV32325.1 integrase [Burkholderia cenocepacia]RQV32857.1 integrase [Burkholderia cenocepacia]RQV68919.1 integrase [Burkholderia cenocepacia]